MEKPFPVDMWILRRERFFVAGHMAPPQGVLNLFLRGNLGTAMREATAFAVSKSSKNSYA